MKANMKAVTTPALDEQIAELARELALRRAVYPRLIAAGRLRRAVARENLARLRAALRTLERQRRKARDRSKRVKLVAS
jgi:phage shock protein A